MIDRIADELAIRTVQQNYFHGVDSKDWAVFGAVLAEDAVFDFSKAVDEDLAPICGREAIVRYVRDTMQPVTSAHRGFLRKLEFADADTAHALWAMEDTIWTGEAGSMVRLLHGHGHYHITYRRIGGGWKIHDWVLTRMHVEQL